MKRILFLTSTVTPSNIKFVGTQEQRRLEYLRAIGFYLQETDYHILVVDNSGYDFSQDFKDCSRLECLAFKAEDHSAKGKGYGELCLMKYGFEHSRFLIEADQIVKITGRHIVKNINRLLQPCQNRDAVYADIDIKLTFAMTYFFVAPRGFYEEFLFPNMEKLNDSQHFFLEHLVGKQLQEWLSAHRKFHEFRYPIHLVGHQGASCKSYRAPGLDRYLLIGIKYMLRECMNIYGYHSLKRYGR